MIKLKEGKFYITVNPFTREYTITVYHDSCTHVAEMFYQDTDEWTTVEIAGVSYDIHVLYDGEFWIYVTKEEEGVSTGCGESQEVEIEVVLRDGGPAIKMKKKKY